MKVALFALVSLSLSSCITMTKNNPLFIYGKSTEPSYINPSYFDNNTDSKTGKACAETIFYVGKGDSSIDAAKKNGNISHVSSISREVSNFIIGSKVCTIVHGK